MTNPDLAAEFVMQADDLMRRRKILLAASVALAQTSTPAAAIKALRALTQSDIRDPAIALIEAGPACPGPDRTPR